MPDGICVDARRGGAQGSWHSSAHTDKVVRLWDPLTLQPAGELPSRTGSVWAACAVPLLDGRTLLATTGTDRSVLSGSQPLTSSALLCRRVGLFVIMEGV